MNYTPNQHEALSKIAGKVKKKAVPSPQRGRSYGFAPGVIKQTYVS